MARLLKSLCILQVMSSSNQILVKVHFPLDWSRFQLCVILGGINKFSEEGGVGRDGYFGWFGYGGSVFQWNPELKIGFAYTPTLLHWFDMTNGRGRLLQQEVVNCVKSKYK